MKIRTDRLLKLAEHLENGELGHERFNFAIYNGASGNEHYDETGCGTVGCALGECPIVWPNHWHFKEFMPQLIDKPVVNDGAHIWFGIDLDEKEALFYPEEQRYLRLPELGNDATKEEVAANIRLFCSRVVDGKYHIPEYNKNGKSIN